MPWATNSDKQVMLSRLKETFRHRVLIAFSFVHVGLLLAIFATARLSVTSGFDANLCLLLAGLLLLYFGTVFGAFFLIWPLVPLLRGAQEARHWWDEVGGDITSYVDLFHKVLELLKPLIQEWVNRRKAPERASSDSELRQ